MRMSDVGNCCDNVLMKSFWATLKAKLTSHKRYEYVEALNQYLVTSIEIFYYRQRLHSGLGYDLQGSPPADGGANISGTP